MAGRSEKSVPTRREEVFEAAATIFWEKGYHATSMRDLAEAMGMRKGSLYHHLSGKEDLLYEISVSSMREITDSVRGVAHADPEERLRRMIVRHMVALMQDREKHATALVELRSLAPDQRRQIVELRTAYERIVDDAIHAVQSTTGRWSDVPTRFVRMALLGILNWSVFWYRPDGAESPEGIARYICQLLLPLSDSGASITAQPSSAENLTTVEQSAAPRTGPPVVG